MALSHPLKFSLTYLSRLLIVVVMSQKSSEYRKAYEVAKQELTDLLAQQEYVEKRIVVVRQSIQTLATLCESEGVEVKPSAEAEGLLSLSSLAADIRAILGAHVLIWFRPLGVKSELERLGRDLSEYRNPQATIHMVLKRMVESGEIEERTDDEGKAVYMKRSMLDAYTSAGRALIAARAIPEAIERDNMHSMKGLDSSRAIPELDDSEAVANHPLNKLRAKTRKNPAFYKD